MTETLELLISYLASQNFMKFLFDTRVIIGLVIIFVLAVVFRWKWVLVFLLLGGGSMAFIRYTNFKPVEGNVDPALVGFIVGSVLITLAIIYLVFIRSD